MNSETILSYNNKFGKTNRDIELKGQAFLNVKHNYKLPLVINCKGLKIKVLGTKFDVEAYPENGKVNVVLESGSVELSTTKGTAIKYTMNEGELASYNCKKQDLSLTKVNAKQYVSWHEGRLYFRDECLVKVFEKLERRYDIDIIYNISDLKSSKFTATV